MQLKHIACGVVALCTSCARYGYDHEQQGLRDSGKDAPAADALVSGDLAHADALEGQDSSSLADLPLDLGEDARQRADAAADAPVADTLAADAPVADTLAVDGPVADAPPDQALEDSAASGDVQPWPDSAAQADGPEALTASCTLLSGVGAPSARRSTGAALQHQPTGDTLWIFGGFTSGQLLSDLYAFHTSSGWAAATQSNVPSARELHSLAWYPDADSLVMFGGQEKQSFLYSDLDQLQVYDPVTQSWQLLAQTGSWPEARRGATFLWVPQLGGFLLFGGMKGIYSTSRFDDLWLLELSGTAGALSATWTQLSPSGTAPPAVNNACSGYDPSLGRLILFGGEIADGDATSAVYQYAVASNSWQLDSPGGDLPPDCSYAQCAWDPKIGRLIAYGGQDSSGAPVAGLYLYEPSSQQWSYLDSAHPMDPGPRADGSAAYSSELGGVLWFGGRTAITTYTNETWLVTFP